MDAVFPLAVELSRITLVGIVLTGIVVGLLLGLFRLVANRTRGY